MRCEECGTRLFEVGERAPAGIYVRVDDSSYRQVRLVHAGTLPVSFDGHITFYRVTLYRAAAAPCVGWCCAASGADSEPGGCHSDLVSPHQGMGDKSGQS